MAIRSQAPRLERTLDLLPEEEVIEVYDVRRPRWEFRWIFVWMPAFWPILPLYLIWYFVARPQGGGRLYLTNRRLIYLESLRRLLRSDRVQASFDVREIAGVRLYTQHGIWKLLGFIKLRERKQFFMMPISTRGVILPVGARGDDGILGRGDTTWEPGDDAVRAAQEVGSKVTELRLAHERRLAEEKASGFSISGASTTTIQDLKDKAPPNRPAPRERSRSATMAIAACAGCLSLLCFAGGPVGAMIAFVASIPPPAVDLPIDHAWYPGEARRIGDLVRLREPTGRLTDRDGVWIVGEALSERVTHLAFEDGPERLEFPVHDRIVDFEVPLERSGSEGVHLTCRDRDGNVLGELSVPVRRFGQSWPHGADGSEPSYVVLGPASGRVNTYGTVAIEARWLADGPGPSSGGIRWRFEAAHADERDPWAQIYIGAPDGLVDIEIVDDWDDHLQTVRVPIDWNAEHDPEAMYIEPYRDQSSDDVVWEVWEYREDEDVCLVHGRVVDPRAVAFSMFGGPPMPIDRDRWIMTGARLPRGESATIEIHLVYEDGSHRPIAPLEILR